MRQFEHDRRCSIAVNGAIIRQQADYWAILDPQVFDKVISDPPADISFDQITMWIPNNFALLGMQKGLEFGNWTELSSRAYESMKKRTWDQTFFDRVMFNTQIPWIAYTKFTAIALAILEGATVINLYGDDMRGYGYFKDGFTNALTIHTGDRWYDERTWTELIVSECMKRNIKIKRIIHDREDESFS